MEAIKPKDLHVYSIAKISEGHLFLRESLRARNQLRSSIPEGVFGSKKSANGSSIPKGVFEIS
jgi:hypothetical protein